MPRLFPSWWTSARRTSAVVLGAAALAAWAPVHVAHAQITQQEYAARRDSLAARFKYGVLIAFGPAEWPAVPPPDDYHFSRSASFLYLTGVREPNAVLVMAKQGGKVVNTIFAPLKASGASGSTGHGPSDGTQSLGMARRPLTELRQVLDSLLGSGSNTLFYVGDVDLKRAPPTPEDTLLRGLLAANPKLKAKDAISAVVYLRGSKSPAELAALRKAIAITLDAHAAAFGQLKAARNEHDIQVVIEDAFRKGGATGVAFPTIVGSGPHSTLVHSFSNDRVMTDGDMVVMDIGASYDGYAADVTRTVPVNGKFTPEQRAIYQAVRNAQAAAERAATLGAPKQNMVDSANVTLARELAKLGLIESPDAMQQVGLYYMHGLGHPIGLEVHDVERMTGVIRPGDAFTIEPGIYVRDNVLELIPDVPATHAFREKLKPLIERYKNIGVRIEDDYFATDTGVEWVSRSPREVDELEAAMANVARASRAAPTHGTTGTNGSTK